LQTFVPYADFARCAQVLDDRRLGKQRVEVLQLIRATTWPDYGWRHHPAALMWKGYEEALGAYGIAICAEWCRRGKQDTCDVKIRADLTTAGIPKVRTQRQLQRAKRLPPWWGDEAVHRSHRSSLLRKDPEHYGPQFEPDLPDDLDYVWPVRKGDGTSVPPR
jgi:hypothetical protein